MYEKACIEARTDEMTGLLNRKYFYEVLNEEFEKNKDSSLALAIINVDDFKLYNQLYGIKEGDVCLQHIAAIIRSSVGDSGYIARHGGKEFAVLLPKYDLVTFTWGNVSGIDRESGLFVIKPSGVEYDKLTPEDMVVVDLNGNKVEGRYNPSSDTPTHVVLYNRFPKIGGVVHTHSPWATSWAQAGRGIPCYGTTHADYLYGTVPCVRNLTKEEIDEAYEKNTGVLIADEFAIQDLDYIATPAVLCKNHGPFTWGKDAHEAVHNAVVLEEVAKMAARAELINPQVKPAPQELQDKHYYRKHGANAYYGQPGR